MRTFYDAVTPGNIPANAQGVCGYIDGRYAWHANDWARFPHAVKVRIAVFASTNDGHVLDVEPGCSTPTSAPGWVVRRRAAGADPSVYIGYGYHGQDWANLINEFHRRGIPEPHYWVAAYPGNGPSLYPGSVAHQWQGGMTAPVDVSVVADHWPGVDGTAPPVKPAGPVVRSPRVTWGVQHAIRVKTTGQWTQETTDAGNAILWRDFKWSVRYLQWHVGAATDGDWGPVSEGLRLKAIAGIQSAIGVSPDGIRGPDTLAVWAATIAANQGK